MSSRDVDGYSSRDDRYSSRGGSSRGDDRGHRSSRRDYDDDRYSSSRRDSRDDRYSGRRDDYGSSRSRHDDDRYGGSRHGRPDDRDRDRGGDRGDRDRGGHRSHRDDRPPRRDDRGGGGGGKGWRDNTPERRSPTPEGTVPLSQRKRQASGWDLHAAGYERYTAMQAKGTGMFNLPGANRTQPVPGTLAPPMDAPMPSQPVYFNQAPAFGGPGVANQNMARQSRRLYVGSITYEANEENIAAFFNAKMVETGLGTNGPGDAVIGVQINHEKSYAFVEFRTAEDATAAMAFDGIIFQATPLKIRRPKDYSGPDPVAPVGIHVPGVVSTNVPDSINKIFVGGLPTYLNDEQVMELLKSFGELKAFNLVKDTANGTSKGFAFFEYVDPSVTDVACQGLNGMELGDRFLVVQRAAVGAKPPMDGNMNMPGMPSAEEYQNALMGRRMAIPRALDVNSTGQARILLLLNMVTPDDLMGDQDYAEILEDIKDECSNYGTIEDVRIPRPSQTTREKKWGPEVQAAKEADEANGVGRVYIKYGDSVAAGKALAELAGRAFAGRSIVATLIPDDADVSPPLSVIFGDEGGHTNGNAPSDPPPPPAEDGAPPPPPPGEYY